MKFVIMTVGKTHSGKTTFWFELANKLKNSVVLDGDILAEFLEKTYPWLYSWDFKKNSTQVSEWFFLKLNIFVEIFKHAQKTPLNLISTASNSSKKIRTKCRRLTHSWGRKLILVYFNLDEKILLDRIKISGRWKWKTSHIKEFTDLLLNKQKTLFETPTPKEADYFFEINDQKSYKEVMNQIIILIKN